MELYGIRQKKRQTMPLAGIFMAITAVGVYRSFCDEFSYPANYREVYLAIFIFSLIFTLTGMLKSIPKIYYLPDIRLPFLVLAIKA